MAATWCWVSGTELAEKVSRGHKENALKAKFNGGPVGLTTIATALGEDAETVEEVYEPFLIKEGFIKRTPRGREVTHLAYSHLNRNPHATQGGLF